MLINLVFSGISVDKSKFPEVTIKPSGKVISVMEGKTLSLICEVAGKDMVKSVQWTRQSTPGVLSQDFELNFVKIKTEDTGIYECSVKTETGEGKASLSVIVQSKNYLFISIICLGGGGVNVVHFGSI